MSTNPALLLKSSQRRLGDQEEEEEEVLFDTYNSRRRRHDDHLEDDNALLPVPLVVGGSDGSGSRAIVATLLELGVPMIVDDATTLDYHASALFDGKGWPPLVSMVLPHSSTSFSFEKSLPLHQQTTVIKEMKKVLQNLEMRAQSLMQQQQNNNSNNNSSMTTTTTNSVSYGFKAPISMLLLPILQQANLFQGKRFKFLHVIRDGRDVALSDNQSPVQKFYRQTYPDTANERIYKFQSVAPVFGMQLWNDWNSDLLQWATQQQSNNSIIDYHVIRIEDLMNPETRFETLRLLADFVGSSKTLLELCCQSRTPLHDLGPSVHVQSSSPALRRGTKRGRNISEEEDHHDVSDDDSSTHETSSYYKSQPSSFFGSIRMMFGSFFLGRFMSPADLALKQVKRLKHKAAAASSSSSSSVVSARYGKWENRLASSPELSTALHEEGARGLRLFGYFPSTARRQMIQNLDDDVCVGETTTAVCPETTKSAFVVQQQQQGRNSPLPLKVQ